MVVARYADRGVEWYADPAHRTTSVAMIPKHSVDRAMTGRRIEE